MEGGGFISKIIQWLINSESIYLGMTKLAGASALILWLLAIFMAVRIFQEGLKSMNAKAAIAEAAMSLNKTVIMYLAYTSLGTFLFGFIFILNELFEYFGSQYLINNEILNLREKLINSEKEYIDWVEGLLTITADIGNVITGPLVWTAYQLISLIYVFINQLIDVLFAVGVALLYVWGFVAIGTMSLSKPWDISKGWVQSVLTLFIWAMVEPILMGFIYIMILGATSSIANTYSGGLGVTSITIWYFFTSMVLSVVMLFKILAPFLAVKLASNESIGGVLGAGAAVPAAIMMNQMLSRVGKQGGAMNRLFSGIMPNGEGGRFRDSMAQKAGDVMGANVSDVAKKVGAGLGNLTGKKK